MKKRAIFLMVSGFFVYHFAFSQCTPDPTVTYGIKPDTIVNLPPAYVGSSYSTDIQFKVPTDTVVSGFTFTINYIKVDSLIGLPEIPGQTVTFSYTCTPSACQFPGSSNGCAQITGPAPATSDTGTYNLTLYTTTNATNTFLGTLDQPTTYTGYKIRIIDTTVITSVRGLLVNKFELLQNNSNSFAENREILFTSPKSDKVEFKIYTLLGKTIYNETIHAQAGINTYRFNSKNIPAGFYFLLLSNGEYSVSQKIAVVE